MDFLSNRSILLFRVLLLFACVLAIPVSSTQSASLNVDKSLDSGKSNNAKHTNAVSDGYPWNLDLTNGYSQAFNLASQQGKVWLLSFFFTQCSTRCPIQNVKLLQVQKNLTESILGKTHFFSVSIDPEGDTIQRISEYQKPFQINPDHWTFGKAVDFESLNTLLEQLAVGRSENTQTGEIDHRTLIFLINPEGTVVQTYSGTGFDEQRLTREISILVELSQST